jgi:hypothetical protein
MIRAHKTSDRGGFMSFYRLHFMDSEKNVVVYCEPVIANNDMDAVNIASRLQGQCTVELWGVDRRIKRIDYHPPRFHAADAGVRS